MNGAILARTAVQLVMISIAVLAIFPFFADYVIFVIGLLGIGMGIIEKNRVLIATPIACVWLAGLLLLVTIPFVFRGTADLVPLGASLLVLVSAGMAVIFLAGYRYISPIYFHICCLTAVVLAVLAGGLEHLVTGIDRVGVGNNPIHYAALSVLLGFLAIPGVVATSSRLRFMFLLGPLLALAAAVLSGSRGPLLATLMLSLVTAVIFVLWYSRDRALMGALVGVACIAIIAAALVGLVMPGRALSVFSALGHVASGGSGAIDQYRLAMYRTALSVLQSSPFYGIGFGQIMPLTVAANADLVYMYSLQDLHSDPANFSASAGVPGLLAYLLLVAAPVTLWRRDQHRLNLTIILLAAGQLSLGLTNTTFGILPQTMLYAAALGYCLAVSIALRQAAKDASDPS